jgi:hypothetical protein
MAEGGNKWNLKQCGVSPWGGGVELEKILGSLLMEGRRCGTLRNFTVYLIGVSLVSRESFSGWRVAVDTRQHRVQNACLRMPLFAFRQAYNLKILRATTKPKEAWRYSFGIPCGLPFFGVVRWVAASDDFLCDPREDAVDTPAGKPVSVWLDSHRDPSTVQLPIGNFRPLDIVGSPQRQARAVWWY